MEYEELTFSRFIDFIADSIALTTPAIELVTCNHTAQAALSLHSLAYSTDTSQADNFIPICSAGSQTKFNTRFSGFRSFSNNANLSSKLTLFCTTEWRVKVQN